MDAVKLIGYFWIQTVTIMSSAWFLKQLGLFRPQSYWLARHRKMVKTQVAGVGYEDCKLVIFLNEILVGWKKGVF